MAKRYYRPISWVLSALVSIAVLGLIQVWWHYDYKTTVLQVDYDDQPYFKDILVHTSKADARIFGSVSHHDSRYLSPESARMKSSLQIRESLLPLLSSFFCTMNHLGLKEAWIAHDVLLGHHFGRHLLPWRMNLDVQISEVMMKQLIYGRYNNTRHDVWFPPQGFQRNQSVVHQSQGTYILDISPKWAHTNTKGSTRRVDADARWIDIQNGKFIDLRVSHLDARLKQSYTRSGDIHQVCNLYIWRMLY